jgi:hypothetical protein
MLGSSISMTVGLALDFANKRAPQFGQKPRIATLPLSAAFS